MKQVVNPGLTKAKVALFRKYNEGKRENAALCRQKLVVISRRRNYDFQHTLLLLVIIAPAILPNRRKLPSTSGSKKELFLKIRLKSLLNKF